MKSRPRLAIVDCPVRATAQIIHHQTWSLGYNHGVLNAAIPKYAAKEVLSTIIGEQAAYA